MSHSRPHHYAQPLTERVVRFCIPIHKVLKQPLRHFTSLKLCNCSQIPPPSLRVAPTRSKTNHRWLNHLQTLHTHTHTHTKLRHLARGRSEWRLSNRWVNKRKSGTHLPFSFHLINARNKNIKPYIHPASLFRSATPRTKRRTHLLGR